MKTELAIAKENLIQVNDYIRYYKKQLKNNTSNTKISTINKKNYRNIIEDLEAQKWKFQIEIESLISRIEHF